jgi:hypothetical protein
MKPKRNLQNSAAIAKPKGKTKPRSLSDEALGAVKGGTSPPKMSVKFAPEYTRTIAKAGGAAK